MSKKHRVSAKQRLDLVDEAFRRARDSERSPEDLEQFFADVEYALRAVLEPRNKAHTE